MSDTSSPIRWPLKSEISVHIQEFDPRLGIVFDLYDEEGNIIGRKSEESIKAEIAEIEDCTVFHMLCVLDGKQIQLKGRVCRSNEREASLACLFDMLCQCLMSEASPLRGPEVTIPHGGETFQVRGLEDWSKHKMPGA